MEQCETMPKSVARVARTVEERRAQWRNEEKVKVKRRVLR